MHKKTLHYKMEFNFVTSDLKSNFPSEDSTEGGLTGGLFIMEAIKTGFTDFKQKVSDIQFLLEFKQNKD